MSGSDTIPNESLRLEHIPGESATWDAINEFAHKFNGYEALGSFEKWAVVAAQRNPDTLTELRACLFFEARSLRHGGDETDEQEAESVHSLLAKIRLAVLKDERS